MKILKKRTIFFTLTSLFFALIFGVCLGALTALTVNTKNTEFIEEFNLSLPTKLYDINNELITEFAADEKREMININKLPQHFIDALITREDRIFYKHKGFSLKSIFRAVVGKLTNQQLGGGSTLTQQIAGTLYCDRTDYSITRKVVELWWAIQMERRFSKDEILELYLNKVYLGGGTYGVNAASKHYFGHGAEEITPAEAAILVIQLSNPTHYNPFDYPNRARDRQLDVLNQMVADGYLTQAQADESFDQYWLNFDYTRTSNSAYKLREDAAPWFSEYVLRELQKQMYGTLNVYTDGFSVNTTLNLNHQRIADEIMAERIEYANNSYTSSSNEVKEDAKETYIPLTELVSLVFNIPELKVTNQLREKEIFSVYSNQVNPILDLFSLVGGLEDLKISVVNRSGNIQKNTNSNKQIEGTMISIENNTGYITALVGGSSYSEENQFIRATQATLQPGSTFKPLYYSAAIDSRKFTAASILYDTPTVFKNSDGSDYIITNYKGTWEGPVQLWYALSTSMNIPSIRVLDGIGFDAAIERVTALLGIPESEREARSIVPVYPLGLGVCTVQPIQMARAFAIFGNQGKEVTPIAIRSVADKNGDVFYNPEKTLRYEQQEKGEDIQVITPQTAFVMTEILKRTVTTGTLYRGSNWGTYFRYKDANGKTFKMPMAGKTGTTQNWSDAWTVGYSPYYTAAFWFGFDQKGTSLGTSLTGATLAGPGWGKFMDKIHEGLPYREFSKPQTGVVEATVCSVSGELLTSACGGNKTTQWFLEGTEPTTMCTLHITRETDKIISVERLRNESILTGNVTDTSELDSIYLDLSFLENDFILPDTYYKEIKNSKNNTIFEVNDISKLPTSNYLLD
ncbi:MAG: PBP1A family penicillin-binding protein [Treponemataceae bacterium]|nr:PBP1A family penicillin-binding protein [Treponemataceae bacterium]